VSGDYRARALVVDLVAGDPIAVAPDASVAVVARMLEDYGIGGMPVVDGGRLVGVVSRTDLVRLWASPDPSLDWRSLPVREVMTQPAVTVRGSATLQEAARVMADSNVARLVVVGEDADVALGVISDTDLVRAIGREPATRATPDP
jgi:IMP dehydrogenase